MKQLFILIFLLFSFHFLIAQKNEPRNFSPGQGPNGRFYGRVVDGANKGVQAASVVLLRVRTDSVSKKDKETIVGGMLTTASGGFSLENIPLYPNFLLRITGMGYKTIQKTVSFELPHRNQGGALNSEILVAGIERDLGNIKLNIDEKILGNITITANKPMLQLGIDRKIFNVANNLTSIGGTAVDVMRNVPSLQVDIDGNVTLRNNAPTLFVDGRPTNLTLEQIPADAIESVEVITNPSAKFDASGGTAGILNIVMKKNKRIGYNGNIRGSIDSRPRVGAGGDLNIRENKINVFASGNMNQRKSISQGTTTRTTNFGNVSQSSSQTDRNVQTGFFDFLRGGLDYFFDNRNTLTINGHYGQGRFTPTLFSDIDSFLRSDIIKYDRRLTNSLFQNKNSGAQVSYKHNFPQNGREFSADITFNNGTNNSRTNIITTDYRMPQQIFDHAYGIIQNTSGSNQNLIAQSDYVNPINDHSKIESGARLSLRKINSSSRYYRDSLNNGITYPTSDVLFNSTDNVYAAYAIYSRLVKKFGYQLGLRVESSQYLGSIPTKGSSFSHNFPLSFFPSIFLSEKISDNDQLQLNYSRRINRPNFFQLFPFIDSSDLLNISAGNPGLRPEFTNSFEISYSKTFPNRDNFLFSLYYKHTVDLITRYYDTTFSKKYLLNTFINANNSFLTGVEIISRNKISPLWELTTNLNLFTARINVAGQVSPSAFPSYFFKLNNSFKLPKNISVQLSGDYQSKVITSPGGSNSGGGGDRGRGFGGGVSTAAQGFIRPNYGLDAAIRYEFLKNKVASFSISVNDLLRTRRYNAHSQSAYFVQDIYRTRDAQLVRLNFNFRFGKFDASLFKRKNTKAENNVNADQNF
ncbi:MAG: TonB-dependent receptor [Flavisolibacter sp.]